MLRQLQNGLERLYRIETALEVEAFLIDEDERDAACVARSPGEQLLLREDPDGLCMGLFVHPRTLGELAGADVAALVRSGELGHFLLALEGVSHFVYLAWRAQRDQPVSALELELQAEVDKYVTCLLSSPDCVRATSRRLRRQLFLDIEYHDDLDHEERDRYRVANDQALRYTGSLEQRFVRAGRLTEMFRELRRFYRMGLGRKLEHIAQAA